MLTDTQKQEFLGQLIAFMHANVDNHLAMIEAKVKATGDDALLMCIVRDVNVPPLVMGGEPRIEQQIVPIFQFIDPHKPNPYVSADPSITEVAESSIVTPDAHRGLRSIHGG